MDIQVNVINQKLKIATNLKNLVAGTQQFIRFVFNLPNDWKELTIFAQFSQNENSYNQYLDDDNSVYLPSEIESGTCTLMLYGTKDSIIGTTNYITLSIDENILVSDANSTDISESLYNQLVSKINSITVGAPVTDFSSVATSQILDNSAYFLVTQPVETDDESATEEARRIPLSVLVDYLKYEPIDITSITNSVRSAEIGSTVNSVKVSWSLNRSPASQTVTVKVGDTVVQTVDVATTDRAAILTDLNLTEKTIFTVDVADERGATNSEDTGLYFYNGVYYGVLEDGVTLDSAAILSLKKNVQNGRSISSFTAEAGTTQRIAYALPNSYGTPTFKDIESGFQAGFYLATEEPIQFTNDYEHMELYNIWLSTNLGLGTMKVSVS